MSTHSGPTDYADKRLHYETGSAVPDDDRLNLLLQTLAHVAISVELQPTLTILLDSLQQLVPFDAGGIFVRETRSRSGSGASDARVSTGSRNADGSGPRWDVMRTGQSRLVRDVLREPTYVAIRPSTCVQLTVPLSSPRGILGAIVLESDRPHGV